MKTIVLKINANKPEKKKIQIVAKVIKKGGLVAFPTETVYGLGADAFNPKAVKKIFQVKNRPFTDPLIVHIAEKKDLFIVAKSVPEKVKKLVDKFWPGPLTIILKKSKLVPDIVTANLNTVAVRMPNNKIALSLIREAKTPIAAPSANLFGKPSATIAKHVIEDLKNKVDLIIDSGKTNIGIESTVVDFSSNELCGGKVLRPGAVTIEMLKEFFPLSKLSTIEFNRKSPGMFQRHYSPKAKLILRKNQEVIKKLAEKYKKAGMKVGILTFSENKNKYDGFEVKTLGTKNNLQTCAKNLFYKLREFDSLEVDVIIAETVREKGIGVAIMDRLRKAAGMSCWRRSQRH